MKEDLYDEIVNYIIENQNKFYRLAFSYVHNKEDALDVIQNAICKALEHYRTLKNEKAINAWFYRILVNESLQFLKKKKDLSSSDESKMEVPYHEKNFETEDDLYEHMNRLIVWTKICKILLNFGSLKSFL